MEALRRSKDGDHWPAALAAGGEFDWSRILDGYRATLDWPTVYVWEALAAAYPVAKILLTDRDPGTWWDSHVEMFKRGAEVQQELTAEQQEWAEKSGFARMQTALGTIAPAMFDGRVFDKAHCLQVFRAALRTGPEYRAGRAAAGFRVQEGWEPLCGFLGADVPDEPFPRVNVGDNLVHHIRTAIRLARAQTAEPVWV